LPRSQKAIHQSDTRKSNRKKRHDLLVKPGAYKKKRLGAQTKQNKTSRPAGSEASSQSPFPEQVNQKLSIEDFFTPHTRKWISDRARLIGFMLTGSCHLNNMCARGKKRRRNRPTYFSWHPKTSLAATATHADARSFFFSASCPKKLNSPQQQLPFLY